MFCQWSVQRNFTEFFITPELSYGIPLNMEFRRILIPLELFFDGIMNTLFFISARIKLWNSVKFRGIPLNLEFRRILIPLDLFFDGLMDTLFFISAGIKLWNSVKFRGIPLNMEFRRILICQDKVLKHLSPASAHNLRNFLRNVSVYHPFTAD